MKMRKHAVVGLRGLTLVIALSVAPSAKLGANPAATIAPPSSIPTLQSAYGHLPLSFESNQGQWDPQVQFVTRGPGHQLFLTPRDAVLALRSEEAKGERREDDINRGPLSSSLPPTSQSVVRMRFDGANSQAEMVGLDKLPGIVNYLLGPDPSKWRTNIPTYQKVEYKDLYPGVDLVYYGNQGQLEYDFIVAPGADPKQITLAFEGVEKIDVDQQGDLVLTVPQSTDTAVGNAVTLRMHKPVVYQRNADGDRQLLAGTYVLLASESSSHRSVFTAPSSSGTPHVAFQVASYDASQPLIIDPILSWATYLGGSSSETSRGIAVDQTGNAYVAGVTLTPGSGFPGASGSSIQSTLAGSSDAFVAKLNATGTALVYATYLGGSGLDSGYGIAVDQTGNAYVTGVTRTPGSGFPGTAGSLIQNAFGGGSDAFVAKLNATGTALIYATYLGGSGDDYGHAIAVDQAGNAYVTGGTRTFGSGFPGTVGSPIQSTSNSGGGVDDAFVAKLNATGTALVYATYLGGSGPDSGNGIAVDQAGNAYVTGATYTPGPGFPGTAVFPGTTGSLLQSTASGRFDAYVVKLNAAGTALVYSTYLGGSGDDYGHAIAVDQAGNAYVTGETSTPESGFPGTVGSTIQSMSGGSTDAFVVKLNATGTTLVYATYLGASGLDSGHGIAVDQAGNAYVTGETNAPGSGFPGTVGSAIQSMSGGSTDAFVVKLNATGTTLVYATYLGGSGRDFGQGIAVDQAGQTYVTGTTITPGSDFPGAAGSLIQNMFGGGDSDSFVAKITSNDSPVCSAAQAIPAILWSPNHQFVPVLVTNVTDPEGEAVTITVTSVTQDEPVNAKGDGNTSPDAMIQAGAASIRAERSGKGNGRVYQLSFKAEDGKGGFCTGSVKVSVPHSMEKGLMAIDDGQAYDSTVQ